MKTTGTVPLSVAFALFSIVPSATLYGQDPVLLGELNQPTLGYGYCCLIAEDLAEAVALRVSYDPTAFLGLDRTYLPGDIHYVDYDAANSPNWNAFVSKITNGIDEFIDGGVHAVRSGQIIGGVPTASGGPESSQLDGLNRGSVDLAGMSIDFARLLVHSVDIVHQPVGACGGVPCYSETVAVNVVWQLWQGSPSTTGGGQRSDVDEFISFVNPLRRTFTTIPGANAFNVGIVYGSDIDPSTFRATLNGQPYAGFTPAVGTTEVVQIPLVAGRNTLKLLVDGVRSDGRIATDRDSLTFIVP